MKAMWNNQIIAESDKTVVVENNHYFPPESVRMEFLQKSGNQYHCHWKGICDYYNIIVGNEVNNDAAWMYPDPTQPAQNIKGHFAFWKNVEILE